MQAVEKRGARLEKWRVAKIPFGHFAAASREECRVDEEFEVEAEASRGLVLANGS